VLPPGTTGVLHGVRVGGQFHFFDGPTASDPEIGDVYSNTYGGTISVDFDVRFTNGLSVHGSGECVILYKLDRPSHPIEVPE